MGEIINVDFGGGGEKFRPEQEVTPSIKGMADYEHIGEVLEKVQQLKAFLADVPMSLATYNDMKALVATLEFTDVYRVVANSASSDWQRKPMYFCALMDEWRPENIQVIFMELLKESRGEE